jgi:hypothetical protein
MLKELKELNLTEICGTLTCMGSLMIGFLSYVVVVGRRAALSIHSEPGRGFTVPRVTPMPISEAPTMRWEAHRLQSAEGLFRQPVYVVDQVESEGSEDFSSV